MHIEGYRAGGTNSLWEELLKNKVIVKQSFPSLDSSLEGSYSVKTKYKTFSRITFE